MFKRVFTDPWRVSFFLHSDQSPCRLLLSITRRKDDKTWTDSYKLNLTCWKATQTLIKPTNTFSNKAFKTFAIMAHLKDKNNTRKFCGKNLNMYFFQNTIHWLHKFWLFEILLIIVQLIFYYDYRRCRN